MKKRITTLVLSLILVLSMISPIQVFAATFQCASIRFVDMAGLLDAEDMAKVLHKLDVISEAHEMNVVIVTTPDLEGKEPETYADDFFDYNEYGSDGILLLVSTDGNKWHLSTKGKAIKIFNSDARDYMSDDFVPEFSDGNYMDGFMIYAEGCDEILTMAENGDTFKEKMSPMWIFYSLGIGFVIALIMALIKKSQMKSIVAQHSAQDYTREGSVELHSQFDTFINRTTTSRIIKDDDDTHTSSSGESHGGSGGSF